MTVAAPTRHAIALDGIRVSILRWAPSRGGPPDAARDAVVVHGLQSAAGVHVRLAEALAQRGWRVTAPDLPGHGETRWTDAEGRELEDQESVPGERYRLDGVVAVVAAALAAPGVDLPAPDIVVGHSWGAGIAAGLVLTGLRPRRTVLIDPPFLSPESARALGEELRAGLVDSREVGPDLLRSQGDAYDPAELEAKATALSQASPLAQRAVAESGAFSPDELRRRWAAVLRSEVRVDVIVGEPQHGGMVPVDARRSLEDALGEGRVHVIPGAGHSPQRSHRGEFLELLHRILA